MYPKIIQKLNNASSYQLLKLKITDGFQKKLLKYVSDFLNVPEIKVLEIATFYSMYNLSPVGKYHIEVCTTSPCMLRGSDEIIVKLKKVRIGIGEVSKD